MGCFVEGSHYRRRFRSFARHCADASVWAEFCLFYQQPHHLSQRRSVHKAASKQEKYLWTQMNRLLGNTSSSQAFLKVKGKTKQKRWIVKFVFLGGRGGGGQVPVNGLSDELLLGSSSKGTFTLLSTFAYKVKAEKTCFTLIVSSFIIRVNAGPGGPPAPPFTELHNTVALSKRLTLNLLPSICHWPAVSFPGAQRRITLSSSTPLAC